MGARQGALGERVLGARRMKLRRLLNMTVSEVACRGRQETATWWDRLAMTGSANSQRMK